MKFDTRAPCKTCPYRKDVPVGVWHRSEYENLLAQDADQIGGHMFACHQTRALPDSERQVCGGWLLDQKRRNIPSILLRVAIIRTPGVDECLTEITNGGAQIYPSIAAMCRANGVRVPRRST
jgi:hypothetical protein